MDTSVIERGKRRTERDTRKDVGSVNVYKRQRYGNKKFKGPVEVIF